MGRAHEVHGPGEQPFLKYFIHVHPGFATTDPLQSMAGSPVEGEVEREDRSQKGWFPAIFHGDAGDLVGRFPHTYYGFYEEVEPVRPGSCYHEPRAAVSAPGTGGFLIENHLTAALGAVMADITGAIHSLNMFLFDLITTMQAEAGSFGDLFAALPANRLILFHL